MKLGDILMYKILLVDDDWTQMSILSRLISSLDKDFTICKECENGKDAINYLKTNIVDIIFTDIKMPIIDGIDSL